MLIKTGSMIVVLLAWLGVSLHLPDTILPGPWQTITVLAGNFADGQVHEHLLATLGRVSGGLALAMAVGVPVGIVMGVNRFAEKTLDVWVMVGTAVLLVVFVVTGWRLSRREGVVFLATYGLYLVALLTTNGRGAIALI